MTTRWILDAIFLEDISGTEGGGAGNIIDESSEEDEAGEDGGLSMRG